MQFKTRGLFHAMCLFAAACTPSAVAHADDAPAAQLTVVNEHGESRDFAIADLAELPRTSAKMKRADEAEVEYSGVSLGVLLERCGVTLGHELRGPRIAAYVLVEAQDNYKVVIAIAEVDSATTDKVILLADRRNGDSLDDKEGPLRLVIPDEKRQVRCIRMVKRIRVRQVTEE